MKKTIIMLLVLSCIVINSQAQLKKLKAMGLGGKKSDSEASTDTTEKTEKTKGGGNFLTKAVTKLAAASGGAIMKATGMISTTSNLEEVTPLITFNSNLYPAELGTATQAFMKGWKSGGDMITIMFTKKGSMGFNKIDGSVTIDGQPATYTNMGVYVAFSAQSAASRKVEIITSTGQKSSFTLSPYNKPFKILSINGQADNASIDLTKDVVVEFEQAPVTETGLLRLSLAINQLGIKSFYDLPFIKTGKTITIPAASFRNINIVPGGKALYGYKNSYLSIAGEKISTTGNTSGTLPATKYDASYSDGKLLTVVKEPILNPGVTAKGTEKFAKGDVDYTFFKPNAFLARPFNQIKKTGVSSFAIRGTTYKEGKESSTKSSFSAGGTTYTTITTSKLIAQFPQLSNQVWDAVLESLYKDFIAAAQQELSTSVLPLEAVTNTDSYRAIAPFSKDDENTSVEFSRAYKNSKLLSAFMPISEGYGINNANNKIMNQSGANALMKFTFDLQIAIDGSYPVMVPKLAFELVGEQNGTVAETKYCTATIIGKGSKFPEGNISAADLEKIIRKSDLVATFRKGLQELKAKEKANSDYETVWNLQK
ncbi:MAG: hypothetical protein H7Y07_06815 [Pyrinomonadaceae bacterium]|nr:hypothetical protein [Sphingobacteriaceae bacterium]